MEVLLYVMLLIGLIIIYYGKKIYSHRKFQQEKYKSMLIEIAPSFISTLLTFKLFKTHIGVILQENYTYLKEKNRKHGVVFMLYRLKYLVVDPKYIKNVLQQDFQYFTERAFYHNEKDDILSANLFAIGGEKWKTIRSKLSPAFTASKIKGMFDTFLQCGYQLESAVTRLHKNHEIFDFKEIAICYSINVISSCAFGLNNNCFENSNSEFLKQGKRIFQLPLFRLAKVILAFLEPSLGRLLKIRLFDEETTNFFTNIVSEVVNYRKTNSVTRKDVMQQLIELQDHSQDKKAVTTDEITAHAFIFFAAGFETSSSTLTFCMYELSLNIGEQNKLRKEIKRILHKFDGKLSYESLMEMTFMNQVIHETLRKYPPVAYITRVCVKDYQVPNTDFTVPKGTEVIVPVYAIHRDPDFYPDPDKFDPERFSDENKRKIPEFTFLPFGEGPRVCIGVRFGILQLKIALALLIQKYEFSINKCTEVPLKIKPVSFTLVPQNKVVLDITEVKE